MLSKMEYMSICQYTAKEWEGISGDAIAANEESIADKNTNPFLLEANSKHRAKPVLGLFCFGFLFAIVRILLKYKIRGGLA